MTIAANALETSDMSTAAVAEFGGYRRHGSQLPAINEK
jgi:hypothetical protein